MGCNFKKCISFWSQQWYGNGRRKNHLNINMSLIQIFPFYSLLSSQDTFVRSIIRRYVWKVFPFSSRLAAGRRGAGTSKTHFFLPLINFIFRRHSLPSTLTPRGCIKPKYNNKRCRFPSRRNISPQIYCAIKMLLRLMINYMYNKQNLHKLNVFHLCGALAGAKELKTNMEVSADAWNESLFTLRLGIISSKAISSCDDSDIHCHFHSNFYSFLIQIRRKYVDWEFLEFEYAVIRQTIR